jgi:hypothetical protein
MNHLSEEQLIEFRYGDADARARAEMEIHLKSCAQCREAYEALAGVLAIVEAAPVPERDDAYGARVWRQIEPKLKHRSTFDWRAWFALPRLAFVGATAAVIVAAFVAGRYLPRPPIQGPQMANTAISAPVRERILLVAVGDHLDRSQMLLLELENAEAPKGAAAGMVDISAQQQRAGDLVASNRLYRQSAARSGDATLSAVLDDLEPMLIQIAHSPSKISSAQLEEIQRRIAARGILFKVRVVGSEVREREKSSTPGTKPAAAQSPDPARQKL